VAECPPIDGRLLRLEYSEQTLWDLGVEAITAFGFDWKRGRQDKSAHPYTSGSGPDDVRITTRFDPREPFMTLFATLHEAGHGMYEQGVDRRWRRTSLEGGTSLAIHESQSRLWENLVGRSRPFWEHFWPALQRRCPSQLGAATLDEFYRAINRVRPSYIRVEADEATYNLHVMLRVEMELAMLAGSVTIDDLPALWNTKMQEYLGIVPPDAANGVLQDIHWSIGLMGYFATYTLGNVISVQLWEKFLAVEPSRDELMQRGDFGPLHEWLLREIYQHGRRFEPQDLLQRVTGSRIDPQPYLRYLERKADDVYGFAVRT
jgi:carboxypeptidase Taq